jgi:hypothetical protein
VFFERRTARRHEYMALKSTAISQTFGETMHNTTEQLAATAAVASARFIKLDASGLELQFPAAEWSAVLDTTTDLIWSAQNLSSKRLNWNEAEAAVAKLDLLGAKDWRLPTRLELLCLVDETRDRPAIDESFFSCESDWYWTSTPAHGGAECAWVVDFSYGGAGYDSQGSVCFVRAVRPRHSFGPLS